LDFSLAAQLIARNGISAEVFERLQVELPYGGKETNPDGSLTLEGQQKILTIYLENKAWRRQLDIEQIKRRVHVHLNDSPDYRLLVIATDKDHAQDLAALGDRRICFMTWHHVAEAAERLSREAQESKDRLLLLLKANSSGLLAKVSSISLLTSVDCRLSLTFLENKRSWAFITKAAC
jgi:hypothetical protein